MSTGSEQSLPALGNSVKKPRRTSKVPLLLALLALCSSAYLAYQGIYGNFGIYAQQSTARHNEQRLAELGAAIQQLQLRLNTLQNSYTDLQEKVQRDHPNQTASIIYQLNNLITAANQSLVLYHDNNAAGKLLDYALQLLTRYNEPLFAELKINLTKDSDSLRAQATFDTTVIATKLEELYQLTTKLITLAIPAATKVPPEVTNDTARMGAWGRFIANLKRSILGMVKVDPANNKLNQVLVPQDEELVRQHVQIDILNAKQAFLARNQNLWQQSLADGTKAIQQYFVEDQLSQKGLKILQELQQINLENNTANLDLTMQALAKLEQLSAEK